MSDGHESSARNAKYSSPPCLAGEIAPDYFDPLATDPQQALDVARWRKVERSRLRSARKVLGTADRQRISDALMAGIRGALEQRFSDIFYPAVSFYWPIKDEPDLRPLMAALHSEGLRIALPLVETKASPLVFREWTPETRMERGVWNIPVPSQHSPVVVPDAVIAPLVGWDREGYRLGYGGGYFDRTLAAMSPRPFRIGTGLASARLTTIYPQPHDIPFDVILTEHGVAHSRRFTNC